MSRLVRIYPDPERISVDQLTDLLADRDITDATVSVGVPVGWTPASPPHISVSCDGIPWDRHPIAVRATMRFTVRAATTTTAKDLANTAQALLCGAAGRDGLIGHEWSTGPLTTLDTATRTELAWFTTLATLRSMPLAG